MKFPTEIKATLAAALAALATKEQETLRSFTDGLHGWLNSADVPENVKGQLKPLYDECNAKLGELMKAGNVMEAVNSADEMGRMFNWMADVMTRQQEYMARMSKAMEATLGKIQGLVPATSVNGLVDTEVTRRIDAGELLPKGKFEELARTEYERGAREATEQAARVAKRTEVLTTAGLPVDPAVLALADEQFEARKTAAAQRADKLKGLGLSLNSPAFADLAYCEDAVFGASLTRLEAAKAALATHGAPAAALPAGGDPLATVPANPGKPRRLAM